MNVKEFINKLDHTSVVDIVFIINKKSYSYYQVYTDDNLMSMEVNQIKIQGKVTELNGNDVVKVITKKYINEKDIELVVPNGSHYYLITITIT